MNRVYGSEFLGKNQGETISVAGWFFGRLGHAIMWLFVLHYQNHSKITLISILYELSIISTHSASVGFQNPDRGIKLVF